MDVFDDAPGCLHRKPCWVAFCWSCHWVRYQGPCASEAAQDIVTGPRVRYPGRVDGDGR